MEKRLTRFGMIVQKHCFSAGTVVHRGPVHGSEHCGSEHRTIRSLQRGSL